jgi:hypothetical protein
MFGVWGVHRSVESVDDEHIDPMSWGVTHSPTGRGLGVAKELDFWTAVRIALALDDIALFDDILDPEEFETTPQEDVGIFLAAVGAAMHDHYVWPLNTKSICSVVGTSSDARPL